MKWALIPSLLLSFFASFSALAQVSVILADDTALENCSIALSKKYIHCLNDGQSVLLKSFGNGYSAIGKSEQGAVELSVKSIFENGGLLYESNFGEDPLADESASFAKRYGELEMMRFTLQFENGESYPDAYYAAANEITAAINSEMKEIEKMFESQELEVRLEDGSAYRCKKAKESWLRAGACGIYHCGNNPSGERITLALDPDPANSFTFADVLANNKEGFVASSPLASIASSNSPTPLFLPASYGWKDQSVDYKMFSGHYLDQLDELGKGCKGKEHRHIAQGVENFYQNLRTRELIQHIRLFDGTLESLFVTPDNLPEQACRQDGVYYTESAYQAAQRLVANDQSAMSLASAHSLFDYAQGMQDIPWEFTQDGCYARAHIMARRFEELGFEVDKVWVKGDLRVGEGDDQVIWNYHVAPVVKIRDNAGQMRKYVIDPSIMDVPVPVEQWVETMTKHTDSTITETRFPFPANAATYRRQALAFSSSDPYWPTPMQSLSEEEKMEMAAETLERYSGYSSGFYNMGFATGFNGGLNENEMD